MTRRTPWLAALAALSMTAPAPASAQSVEVAPLTAPDLFSAAARETGLPQDLWRGASAGTFRAVAPLLAEKPLSPATRALALRVLATGAPGPEGPGDQADLAGARLKALIALGDVGGARDVVARTPNPERSAVLAEAAAETALLSGEDERACQVGEALADGRDGIYWLRLRAFCRLRSGDAGAAQLTFDLAQSQARDAVYGRLMGARLAGAGDPGPASLRNGLDYALSRGLGLDLAAAKPSPAVAGALSGSPPGPPTWPFKPTDSPVSAAMAAVAGGDLANAEQIRAGLVQDQIPGATVDDLALLDAVLAVSRDRTDGPTLDRLVERGGFGEAKARARSQAASVILAGLGWPMDAEARGALARLTAVEAKAPSARVLAMDLAADGKMMGETALLALGIAAEAGPAGPAAGDRARIVRALKAAGLGDEARAFALEGLIALR